MVIDNENEYLKKARKYYHSMVEVKQLPMIKETKRKVGISNKIIRTDVEENDSWLCDVLGNRFGVQIESDNATSMSFFKVANSVEDAAKESIAILRSLRGNFPGFDGESKVRVLVGNNLNLLQGRYISEMIPPQGPYQTIFPILSSIQSVLGDLPKNSKVRFTLLFSKRGLEGKAKISKRIPDMPVEDEIKEEVLAMWKGQECYAVKIYFESLSTVRTKEEIMKLNLEMGGLSRSFLKSLNNLWGKQAKYKKRGIGALLNIAKVQIGGKSTIFTPQSADFNFSAVDFSIPRAKQLPGEKIKPLTEKEALKIAKKHGYHNIEEYFLDIGYIRKSGIVTKGRAYYEHDSLTEHVLIVGISGKGKTKLIVEMISGIQRNRKDVGIMIVNTAKSGEEKHYRGFKVIRYQDVKNLIPYIAISPDFTPPQVDKVIERACKAITGILGLYDYSARNFSIPITDYYRRKGKLPETMKDVFFGVKSYLKKNPFAGESQANFLKILEDREKDLLGKHDFCEKTRFTGKLEQWFLDYLDGKVNIFLDLFECPEIIQQFIVVKMLEMITSFTEYRNETNYVKLRNIIVFDEASSILSRPDRNSGERSDEFIRRQNVNNITQKFIDRYRSRGFSVWAINQSSANLIEACAERTGLKILFEIDKNSASLYSDAGKFREFLEEQPKYTAVVLKSGERYNIKTHPPNEEDYYKELQKLMGDESPEHTNILESSVTGEKTNGSNPIPGIIITDNERKFPFKLPKSRENLQINASKIELRQVLSNICNWRGISPEKILYKDVFAFLKKNYYEFLELLMPEQAYAVLMYLCTCIFYHELNERLPVEIHENLKELGKLDLFSVFEYLVFYYRQYGIKFNQKILKDIDEFKRIKGRFKDSNKGILPGDFPDFDLAENALGGMINTLIEVTS